MSRLKEIGGRSAYKAYKEWEEGDFIEGEYQGIIGRDKFGKPKYGVKVSDSFLEDGTKLEVGERFSVNACGLLDKKMEDVEEGTNIRVEYGGEGTIEKGTWAGSTAHNVKLFILDDDDTETEQEGTGKGRFL